MRWLCVLLLSALAAAAESETVLWETNFQSLNGIKASSQEIRPTVSGGSLFLEIRLDPENKRQWPQTVIQLDWQYELSERTAVEFECIYSENAENLQNIGFSVKPTAVSKGAAFPAKVKPNSVYKLRLPLAPAVENNNKIDSLVIHINKTMNLPEATGRLEIRHLKLLDCGKVVSALPMKIQPMNTVETDNRMDIEINNLLNNPYLKIAGDGIPPVNWNGEEKNFAYGKSPNNGRAFVLTGDPERTVSLGQSGIILVPGETYQVSGYVKGSNFNGTGGIGFAGERWHKFWGFKIKTENVPEDWHYFEVPFIFTPNRGNTGSFVMYLLKGSQGKIMIDRVILEALTPKGLEGSKNFLAGDDFDARYAAAKAARTFKIGPPSADYKLVWADEFDGDSLDANKWVNYELDVYRESRKHITSTSRCAKLDGKGHLLLRTEFDGDLTWGPFPHTNGKFTPVYGYFECRFKIHHTDMINASFWMLPAQRNAKTGPVKSGHEIDIFEIILPSTERMSQTTHWSIWDEENSKFLPRSGGTVSRKVPGLSENYHYAALEWTPTDYIFYID
ncbi:MAG: family 16 glycosylhydrolase, partial [Lentisphaeria bacterium]